MQSYWMQMTDQATVLEMRETAMPQPGPQQLLLRMHAASLNRGEFVAGHGLHGGTFGLAGVGDAANLVEGLRQPGKGQHAVGISIAQAACSASFISRGASVRAMTAPPRHSSPA